MFLRIPKKTSKAERKKACKGICQSYLPLLPSAGYVCCFSSHRAKGLVSAEVIEIYENRDLAEKYSAMSVPRTFVGETLVSPGLQTEEYFAESLIEGRPVEYVMPTGGKI